MIEGQSMMQHIENTQEMDLASLQADLELRYGTAAAQGIIDQLSRHERKVTKTPDYMDVKAMSELAERFRGTAMTSIWRLKQWKKTENKNRATANLINLEGALLKRQCEDAIKLYRLTHKTYFAMYRDALDAFSKPSTHTFLSFQSTGTQSW